MLKQIKLNLKCVTTSNKGMQIIAGFTSRKNINFTLLKCSIGARLLNSALLSDLKIIAK